MYERPNGTRYCLKGEYFSKPGKIVVALFQSVNQRGSLILRPKHNMVTCLLCPWANGMEQVIFKNKTIKVCGSI